MEIDWVAIALGDVVWISLAFALGLLATQVSLPPLVGFLATGFVLNFFGMAAGDVLNKLADLGITLLLFTVGLKLNLKVLVKPQVWAVTAIHSTIVTVGFGALVFWLAILGLPLFVDLDFTASLTIAFALSFSSTVFAVSTLEKTREMKSLHGSIAIGVLVMQDIAAVIYLAASTGKLPSPWAFLLVFLILLRPLFHRILQRVGHGELLILYGLVLALGGGKLFELVGVKADLGALIFGILIAGHAKSVEMAKSMFGFKDLFLVGFFLSIGMTGQLSWTAVLIGVALVPLILLKSMALLLLMTGFKLRARTALLATLNLSNFSEFGLIVAAIGVSSGWLNDDWLVVFAIALAMSFVISAPLVAIDDRIYTRFRKFLCRFQRVERLPDDQIFDTKGATIAVFGMGRVGAGAYDKMRELHGDTVVGIDFDPELIAEHEIEGRKVLFGDPSDADFWEKVELDHSIETVMLALPNLVANLDALEELRNACFKGNVAATAKFPDEIEMLFARGATSVFDIYTEVGAGFADHVEASIVGSA